MSKIKDSVVAAVKQQSITDFLQSPLDIKRLKPLMTSTPLNPTSSRKRKAPPAPIDNDANQTTLDLGQKNVGTTNCQDCGMVYNIDDIKDRQAHDNFHNRFTNTKFFKVDKRSLNSWKKKHYNEVNVGKVAGTIFKVEKKGQSSLKTKLEQIVKEIVDVQLHICDDVPVFDPEKVINGFVYVVDENKSDPPYIGAVVMTERIFAAKLMPTGKVYRDINKDHGFVAVERLWVHPLIRRKGVASHLLDVVRRVYSESKTLLRSRIAFIDPNKDCIALGKTFLDKGGRWMQYDGNEDDSIQAGLPDTIKKLKLEKEENNQVPKKKIKKEEVFDDDGKAETKPIKKVIKVEKEVEDIKPSKAAVIKIEEKENSPQKVIKKEKDDALKIKKEPEYLKNLCRTIVIDETMDSDTPIDVPLMPPAV